MARENSPRVSVVLPVRNGVGTLTRAVASICRQTFRDWELVVIDDGSDDGTGTVIAELARNDPRIRGLKQSARGIVEALNAGIAAAGGEFIARMDADDESHPERLAGQVEWLDLHREIGLVGCLVAFGGNREASEGYARHVDWINSLLEPGAIALNRFVESPLAHPSVMFRRALIDAYGGYRDGDFPEDYELWLRWCDAGVRMAKVPRVLLTWNDPPARLSRTDARYDPERFFQMKARWIAREVNRVAATADGFRDPNATVGTAVANRRVIVWGAGRPTRKRAAHLETHGLTIGGYVDVDPKKTGRRVGGVPVITPAALPPPGGLLVLGYVATRGARDLIRAELCARGYVEGRDFLMCA